MDNLASILIHLLSLEVDVPSFYRSSDGKNLIPDTPIGITDLSGFLLYREETVDLSACVIVNPSYNSGNFISAINTSLQGKVNCDLTYPWWQDISDPAKGDEESALFHYDTFSQFILSWIAYRTFGHPLSQAGISNDTQILGAVENYNIGKGFFSSIINLTKESLGSLYYQIKGNDSSRFDLSANTIVVQKRMVIGIKSAGGTVNIQEVAFDDISGCIANLPIGVEADISGNKIGFTCGSDFVITFLNCGITGEYLGFENNGVYMMQSGGGGTIWSPNEINIGAGDGYRILPICSGDIFRFEIELAQYQVKMGNENLETKDASRFTLSLTIE